ncbi:MAG: MATE family efflux transporter [Planctomycetales bacterium]|nr:MATE family efflux transporter [bacterium]UNM07586.1 MAG: MATE family efflux transporter [Planctomycetales bacterium]
MSKAIAAPRKHSLISWNSPAELARMILILALPVTLTNALQTLIGFVDTRMVSPLGAEALSSLAVGRTSMWMLMSVFMGLGTGITAYVARLIGMGEPQKARHYAMVGIMAGLIIGAVLGAIGLLVGPKPVQWMVTSDQAMSDSVSIELTRQYAWQYFQILLLGVGAVGFQMACVSVFNSVGKTMFPLWLLVVSNIANFAGNWFLISRYQVAGAAWSTTLTTLIAAAVAFFMLREQGDIDNTWREIVRPLRKAWEMFSLGFPVILQVGMRAMAMLAIIKIITQLPGSVVGQSALHVGLQAESLAFMPAFAFSIAAATLVGQNLGARQVEQARVSALYCVAGSQVIMWTMGILFYSFAPQFIVLFIGKAAPEVVAPAADFLKIMALCLPGLGVGMTLNGALRGSGDTAITAWIAFTAMWVVRLPLMGYLAFDNLFGTGIGLGWGLSGLWWGMALSVYVEAALVFWRFQTGKWKTIKLRDADG